MNVPVIHKYFGPESINESGNVNDSSDNTFHQDVQPRAASKLNSASIHLPAYLLLISLVIVLLVVRLSWLQIAHGNEYRSLAEGNRIRSQSVPAPRGAILDRHGYLLATNDPSFTVTVVPADLPNKSNERDDVINQISDIIRVPAADIKANITNVHYRITDQIPVLNNVAYQQALKWMIELNNFPAVNVIAVPARTYPDGQASSDVIGYTGKISPAELETSPGADILDIVGKTGLEKEYNDRLTGLDGLTEVERDVQSREQRIIMQRDPQPGQTLVTTIDHQLQQDLSRTLIAAVKASHSPGGSAIVLDPNSGEILALATAPTYDNNWFVNSTSDAKISATLKDPNKPLLNRAISGQYPSGSIIKPMIASAALAEKIITPSTTIMSTGGFKVGPDFFPDWKAGGHGITNVIKALAESVNSFFYAVGGGHDQQSGLGVNRMVEYLQKFGWGQLSGVDIPSEEQGFLPTQSWRNNVRPSPWKLGDTYHLSIGQGDLEVTPLQVANSIAAVANGGTLYRPHLMKQILDQNGKMVESYNNFVIRSHVVADNYLSTVRAGMRAGVMTGSSRALQSLPVSSAGKTGTAQFGNSGKTHAWFAAYAPYEHPQIVIVVMIESGGEGNVTALPVARDVLQRYFSRPPQS